MSSLTQLNPFRRRRNFEPSSTLAPMYPRQLLQEAEDFFGSEFESMLPMAPWSKDIKAWESELSCACDLRETDQCFFLTMDLPGVKKDAIDIDISGLRLTVRAERTEEISKGDKAQSWFQERRYGKIQRSFNLPETIDPAKIEADFSNGVLQLLIPKTEATKSEKVKIKSSSGGLLERALGLKKEVPASPTMVKEEKRA